MGLKKIFVISTGLIIILMLIITAYLVLDWDLNLKSEEEKDDTNEYTINPLLWRIEGDNPSYLFGTVHLADESVLTLPDVVFEAVNEVDAVYTEVKMDQETQILTDQLSKLSGGQKLEDLLPKDVANRLDSYLKSKGISLTLLSQYKIWVITSTLILLDEIINLLNNPTLDQYIWNIATSSGKYTDGIETIQEQIGIFDSFSIEEQLDMLNKTLDELENYDNIGKSLTEDMLNAYIDGDLDILQDLMLSGIDKNDEFDMKFFNKSIIDRNLNMTKRIKQLITNNQDTQYFFTIGAAHYYGEYGLVALLEDEGYTVTRVEFNECDSCDIDETRINERCYEPYVTK
ncbi:hypothetical protein AYK20_04530 [Thermoplasmatales archaeon SG8-52-1]|nr:MAG: hypothetical protein AYK20_04530 [Thermoplasmatales archaeon SG8-52-1]